MAAFYDQSEYELRCEWGPAGIQHMATGSGGLTDAVIVVDVISFTTCVDVAVSRGARVYPYRWRDESAAAFAQSLNAILAVGSRAAPTSFSLSPASMLRLPEGANVVLPSPNGATLSLATGNLPTFAGCLRNAGAVARAAAQLGRRITLIPGGERWPDGSLRPALEDLIGVGAILQALPGTRSPEAEAAVAVFLHFRERLEPTLAACSSGKEASERGKGADIPLFAALDASPLAPRLVNGAYQA